MSRILFIAERYAPEIGGLARSGTRISHTLAQMGHDVEVFSLAADLESGQARSEKVNDHLTIHRFGRAKQMDFSLQQSMIFLEWLQNRFPNRPFDLVWSHYAMNCGFMGTWFAQQFAIPSVLSVRGNDVDRQLFPPGDFSRLDWSLRNATQVVAVSKDLATKVKILSTVDAMVLENSVDADTFSPGSANADLMKKYEISREELVLIFSGELRAKKGLPMLIECFRRLSLKRPTKLLIIGEVRGKEMGRFQNIIAGIENAKNIICSGHLIELSDIVEHMRLGDAFVLPSLWDGLPNSMLEAMACGIPVFASDAGAIPEVIRDGTNGNLIPRTHLHHMADRIEHFFSKPAAERKQLTDQARHDVVLRFSPHREQENLQSVINKTLNGWEA